MRPALRTAALLIFVAVALPGCGSKVDGTYEDADGIMTVTLKSGGKATVGKMGAAQEEATYTADGNKVVLTPAAGGESLSLTLTDDGSLQLPEGGPTLKKKG